MFETCGPRVSPWIAALAVAALATAGSGCDGDERNVEAAETAEPTAASLSASSANEPAGATPPTQAAPAPPPPSATTTIKGETEKGDETRLDVKAPVGWRVVRPPSEPDPTGGRFGLRDALAGLPSKKAGGLVATIETSEGDFVCDLFDDRAPAAVAQFVGLARGLRPFWDVARDSWVKRPYYDGSSFHRIVPGFMIQGGDPAGDGRSLLGYVFDTGAANSRIEHDRPGQLCLAAKGDKANQAQFFITEAAAPKMDGQYSVFGHCEPPQLVYRIARGTHAGPPTYQALRATRIEHVKITRVPGGAARLAAGKPAPKDLPDNARPGVIPPGHAVELK